MKITVNQRDLSKHISIAQKGISNRTTLQILDGLLFQTVNNKLKIVSTDLEISIETFLDCQIEREGSVVVNSRIFGDIIKKLPNEDIHLEIENNSINIKCNNSEFNIVGSPGEEYPELPLIVEQNSFSMQKDIFKEIIKQTVFATAQDETRISLTGVLAEINNNLVSFVSLDGYRLALKKVMLDRDYNIDEKIIIPGRTLTELNKILEDSEDMFKISLSTGNIIFDLGDTIMYSKLLDGQFFNYREIIRDEHETSIVVDKQKFQNSLERASLLAKEEKANLVRLTVSDNAVNIRSNSEIGDVHEEVLGEQIGDELNIAFNSRYILEGIRNIESDEIILNFVGSLNPCIINGTDDENYIYLVLPVRLAQDDF